MMRGSASWITVVRVLAHLQFARLRRHWRPYVVVSAVMPAGIVLLLHLTSPAMSMSERADVVPGAMLLAQAISGIVMLSQFVAWLKTSHALDHYRVLPISLGALVLILSAVYGLFSWPGVLVIACEGRYLDHLPFHFSATFLFVLCGNGFTLGSIGIMIGLLAPDEGLAGLFGNLVMMAVLFAGMAPLPAHLAWVHALLWILPSTGGLILVKALSLDLAGHHLFVWMGVALYGSLATLLAKYFMARPS